MANSPLVTIVTPSYNQANFLEATIHSVLSQDYAPIEYIVIDGGSTDGSVEIISRYANQIAYWVSEPDQGQSHAINKGFARATGDIVAWLNSDDLYTEKAVTEAVDCLERNPKVGMVYSNCLLVDKESRVTGWSKSRQLDLLDLLSFNIIPQPTVFLRKEVVSVLGNLDTSLHLLFDHQMWTRIATTYPILFEDRYWAAARMHADSKNATRWADFYGEAIQLLDSIATIPAIRNSMLHDKNRIRAGTELFAGNYALTNGDVRSAVRYFAHSIMLHPAMLRRCWLQICVLPFIEAGIVHPGREFEALRQWRRRMTPNPFVSALGERLVEAKSVDS